LSLNIVYDGGNDAINPVGRAGTTALNGGEDFQKQQLLLLLKRKRRRNRSERKKETTVIDRNDIHVVRVDAFSDIRVGNDDSSTPREACVGEEFGGRE